MRQGRLSELEMNQTRAMLLNSFRELQDSAYEMIGYDFNGVLSGKSRTHKELLDAIREVTAADMSRLPRR